jgi:hypothetical protein
MKLTSLILAALVALALGAGIVAFADGVVVPASGAAYTKTEANAAFQPLDADLTAATVGTAGADATKTHDIGVLRSVTLTVTGASLATLADGAHGGGKVEFTFPAGLIYIVGCTATGTVVNSTNFNATTADTYSFAIGSATAADDDDLTSTEANILPKQTIDTASGTLASQVIGAVSTTPAMLNGVSTPAAVYLNYAIAAANNHASNTFGTSALVVKIWYIALGDI